MRTRNFSRALLSIPFLHQTNSSLSSSFTSFSSALFLFFIYFFFLIFFNFLRVFSPHFSLLLLLLLSSTICFSLFFSSLFFYFYFSPRQETLLHDRAASSPAHYAAVRYTVYLALYIIQYDLEESFTRGNDVLLNGE